MLCRKLTITGESAAKGFKRLTIHAVADMAVLGVDARADHK